MDCNYPSILALFQKRIKGDDALLRLASVRFRESGLGVEFNPAETGRCEQLLNYKPSPESPAFVHLPREIDLFSAQGREQVVGFARTFQGRIRGFVVHDQPEIIHRIDEYLTHLSWINSELLLLSQAPNLYIEYASGLSPDFYVNLIKKTLNLQMVNACIDIGHIGINQARTHFYKIFPGVDVCGITPASPQLQEIIEDVETASQSALPAVLDVIREIASLGKPLHFHLHDGHPLSTLSRFGVSDHLSFLQEISIPFSFRGRELLRPMFGPSGLTAIVNQTLEAGGPSLVSFTIEIHPQNGRLPLGHYAGLFNHWEDKTNAERMNYWLDTLSQNCLLVRDACRNFLENRTRSGIL